MCCALVVVRGLVYTDNSLLVQIGFETELALLATLARPAGLQHGRAFTHVAGHTMTLAPPWSMELGQASLTPETAPSSGSNETGLLSKTQVAFA